MSMRNQRSECLNSRKMHSESSMTNATTVQAPLDAPPHCLFLIRNGLQISVL